MSDVDTTPTADAHGAEFDPAPHRPSVRSLFIGILIICSIFSGLVAVGVFPRLAHRAKVQSDQLRADSEPSRVIVTNPARQPVGGGLVLPGSVQPVQETVVYARTDGYVRKYNVDIGDNVKQGQVLAELETPEVDQALRQTQATANQARAMVQQAKTQRELARTTVKRYGELAPAGIASQQDLDEKQASFEAQKANVEAANAAVSSAEANVRRLTDTKNFSKVLAPFDGVITSRTTENGQLVSAGTGAGQALFKVAQIDVVRVFINVPEPYAPNVVVGQKTAVTIREFPERTFDGSVARTANALDPLTRTLLTEVRIPNRDRALLGGMYAQVTIDVARSGAPLLVPATALNVSSDGTRVAVVENGAVKWKKVTVDADLGEQVAIGSGISESDVVVVVASDKLIDGLKVRTEAMKKP